MDFSRTFYIRNSSKNKLLLSKNIFNNYERSNKSAKKYFYITNYKKYNSFSTSPTNNTSNNYVTKNTLKSINKLISGKLEKSKDIKAQLKNFYKDEIKNKIRRSNKYKSVFEKTEVNNSNNMNKEFEKQMIQLKIKSNKKKFNYIITNANNTNITNNNYNINTYNLNTSASNTNHNLSKTKLKPKNLNLNLCNSENINKTHYTTTYYTKETKESTNPNKKENIRNKIYKNILEKITNKRHLPFSLDFREKNLINFYAQTKNFCYKKYFLYLKRNELETAKMRSDIVNVLGDIEINKFNKFYQLLKPYSIDFEKYRIFLKEKIKYEFKEREKLKLIESELVADIVILNKNLINMHKTLKSYIEDKYFLLCVKNYTMNLDKFSEKNKTEFKIDLQNLNTLKRYINEITELTTEENILNKQKQMTDINVNIQNSNSDKDIPFIIKLQKIRENFEGSFNHNITQEICFTNIQEFLEHISNSQTRIENLLKMDSEVEFELANLRDFISHNAIEIKKIKEIFASQNYKYIKYQQDLIDEKRKNKYLLNYKNKIMKLKKYTISNKMKRKIKGVINNILDTHDKKLTAIYFAQNKKFRDFPNYLLKTLEKMINFLIKFKQEQKLNNNIEYMKIIKVIEKNNRISIIEQKKEELKIKAEQKFQEIIEKNTKLLFIKDKRINVKYKPVTKNQNEDLNKKTNKDDEKSIDIFY